jgi:hypothetical protein
MNKDRPKAAPAITGEEINNSVTDAADLTADAAQRLVTRIELRLDTIADNIEQVLPLIEQARSGNAHSVLGYRSWTEFVSEKFGGRLARLDRAERQPLVQLLSEQGMSTRAIAPIVGASKDTVSRDIRAGVSDETPALSAVAGMDGKTYTRPQPQKPRRRPLPDAYKDAVYDLQKSVERLERLHADDRFAGNRKSLLEFSNGLRIAQINTVMERLTDELLGIDDGQAGDIR